MSKNHASVFGKGEPKENASYVLKTPTPIESHMLINGILSAPATRIVKQVTVKKVRERENKKVCDVIFRNGCGKICTCVLAWE